MPVWNLRSVEQTKIMQSVSSELSLASSRVMRMQSPQLRAASCSAEPSWIPWQCPECGRCCTKSLLCWTGRMQKKKSGIRSSCLARLSLGNFCLHPALFACVTTRGNLWRRAQCGHCPGTALVKALKRNGPFLKKYERESIILFWSSSCYPKLWTIFLEPVHPPLLPALGDGFFFSSPSALTTCYEHHKPQENLQMVFAPY